VTTAQQAFDRAKELLKTAAGTQKNFDDAEAALRQANANLAWSETRLARRRALSPAEGTIQQVYYRPGETVPAGRPVVALLPPGNLKIRFFAPEGQLPEIKFDDTVAIELRAVAGATLPLVAPLLGISFTADPAAGVVDDGVTANEAPYLTSFPYLAHPHSGYEHGHD